MARGAVIGSDCDGAAGGGALFSSTVARANASAGSGDGGSLVIAGSGAGSGPEFDAAGPTADRGIQRSIPRARR